MEDLTLTNQENTTPEISIDEKLKILEKKKKAFIRKLILAILLAIGIIVLVVLGLRVKKEFFTKDAFVVVEPQVVEQEIVPDDPNLKNVFDNETFKLKLTYPKDDDLKLVEGEEIYENNVSIINSVKRQDETILVEGYQVKISLLSPTNRTLDQAIEVKKESMKTYCPETSTITKTYPTTVGGLNGLYFAVRDCNGDYLVNYVSKFGLFYEIEQLFIGDLGYIQKYKSDSSDIVRTIEFYPEVEDIKEMTTFETNYFTMEHPTDMSKECCKTDDIPGVKEDKFLDVGYADTGDTLSVSIDVRTQSNYEEYVSKVKEWLIDDYIIVKNAKPNLEDINLKVGDRDATMLKGYTWQGHDIIIVNMSKERATAYLLVSVKSVSGKDFDVTVSEILKSFKFK